MRGRLPLAITLAVLLSAAPSAEARDAIVKSFDGTPIVTHFFPAPGLKAGGRAPTVLVGHGYGQSGDTDPEGGSEPIFGSVGVGPLHRAGYNVLTWDARGFGGSGGQIKTDSKDFEGRDVQALVSYVARQPEAQLDRVGDPRVGMSGPSYGGAIQLVTAGIDRRVDAITPAIAWNSLVRSLYRDGIVKAGWGLLLSGVGTSAELGGLFSPAGPQTGGVDEETRQALVEGAATGRFSARSEQYFRDRELDSLVDRIRIPTLLMEGTADTLFSPQEAADNYEILKRNGVPVKMIWFCGGHGVCLSGDSPQPTLENAVLAWLGRHLKRDASVRTGPAFEVFPDRGGRREGPTFPPVGAGSLTAVGAGTLPIAPGSGGGTLIAASPAADALNVDLPPAPPASDVIGAPRVTLTYSGTGTPADTHVFAQLVDVERNLVLGNLVTPIPVTLDGRTHTITRELEPVAWRAPAGGRLRLQLVAATSVYSPQRSAGALTAGRLAVSAPMVNLAARPRLRLLVGPTRGARKARLGRAFRVRVRSSKDTLRGARVTLVDRRGRRVGRSSPFTLGTRTRRPRIRVRRRLAPGRYRLRATGRSAEGIVLEGGRTLRIRRR